MKVVVTGGGGFLGQVLARDILARGRLRYEDEDNVEVSSIAIVDVVEVKEWQFDSISCAVKSGKVVMKVGDVSNESFCQTLFDGEEEEKMCVFHLGAVMSGAGEADFDLAMKVNLKGTMNMLESARQHKLKGNPKAIFIYASAGATIGSGLDTDWVSSTDVISDSTRASPHTTYGMTKAVGELLLADYHRRSFIDGRGVRLPTVIVRPGKPNAATTSCFSAVVREPLAGTPVALPIAAHVKHAITSYTAAVQGILAFQLASKTKADQVLGPYDRTAFLPSTSLSLDDLAQALHSLFTHPSNKHLGQISYNPNASLSNVVASFPTNIDAKRALALGAPPTPHVHAIIRQYCHDFPNAVHPHLLLKPTDTPTPSSSSPSSKQDNLIVALVTGAGSGIGRATAIKLSTGNWGGPTGKGYNNNTNTTYAIVLVGRRLEPLQQTQQQCIQAAKNNNNDNNPNITLETLVHTADVTSPSSVDHLFQTIQSTYNRLDLLFNNAGTNIPPASLPNISLADFSKVMDANLTSAFLCSKQAIKIMSSQSNLKGGRIINNGSISSSSPRPGAAPYTASKHAVLGLTKSIALDGREHDVACGQIDLGNVTSDILSTAVKSGGMVQPNGSKMMEPVMHVENAADAVFAMASLPPGANVLRMTVVATKMPFVGRG